MSNLSAFAFIPERAEATPSLWNTIFSTLSANLAAINSDVTLSLPSGDTFSLFTNLDVSGNIHAGGQIGIGPTPSAVTTGLFTIAASSATADYIHFEDSSGARSNYLLGSRVGGTADGLNIWDSSGDTLIVGFSKQSIRAYAPVIGSFYDTGGIVTNVKAFGAVGDGVADDTSLIQNALNATVGGGIIAFPSGVYKITSTLSAGARQILRGQGWNSILSSQFSGILLKINGNTTDPGVGQAVMSGLADGFAVEDMVFYSTSTQSSVGLSLVSYSPAPIKTVRIGGIRNVRIQGFDIGADLTFIQGFAFYLTQFLGNRVGLYAHDNSQLGLMGQCDFRANTGPATWLSATSEVIGIVADRIYGWVFDRCHWEINSSYGVLLDGATYNTFLGCKLEQNNGSFSHFTDRQSSYRPDGNIFIGCTWNGDPDTPTVLQVDMPVGVANLFLNNNFNTTANSGLSFGAATRHNMILGGSLDPVQITDRSTASENIYYVPGGGVSRRLLGSISSIEWLSPSYFTAGRSVNPGIGFLSELSLGLYRSAVSAIGLSYGQFELPDGSALAPPLAFSSESSLGFFRSGASTIAQSYGTLFIPVALSVAVNGQAVLQAGNLLRTDSNAASFGINGGTPAASANIILRGGTASPANEFLFRQGTTIIWKMASSTGALLSNTDGSVIAPVLAFSSESSLGLYRSGVSTIAISKGTFNLATNSVRLSMRTLAASAVTASAAKTNVAVDEVVFTIGGASGASLIIYSGGTAYGFNSAFSAAAA